MPTEKVPRRCGECGELVFMPCLACWLKAEGLAKPFHFPNDDSLALDFSEFTPEERERYEAIRRTKSP